MKKTRFNEEQMIGAVKQIEAGRAAAEIARELGVSDQTLYNWRAKYSGLEVNEAKRLREVQAILRPHQSSGAGWPPVPISGPVPPEAS